MAEKILAKLKEIWEKIVAKWNEFTSKQKTAIIAIAAAVVVAFVVLYAIISSPNYTLLEQCKSTKEASEITNVLKEAEITFKVSDDGLQVKVPQKDLSNARLTLAGSGITTTTYTIDQALSGSFTVTEADKQKKYKLYLESTFEEDFVSIFPAIKAATVRLDLPENDGTLLSKNEEPGAAIYLNIEGDFTSDNAAFLAQAVATTLGCSNTNNIVILDSEANLLFSGENTASAAGNASTQLGVKNSAEDVLNNGVKRVLGGVGRFGDIKVTSNLVIDFSTTEETYLSAPSASVIPLRVQARARIRIAGTIALKPSGRQLILSRKERTRRATYKTTVTIRAAKEPRTRPTDASLAAKASIKLRYEAFAAPSSSRGVKNPPE